MSKVLLCAALVLAIASSCAFAGYGDNVSRKADRGFSNALGCWLEIPYQTYTVGKEKGLPLGIPMGLGKGLVMTPLRMLSGVVDIVTFPVPCPITDWNGLMKPEYNPWVEVPPDAPVEKPVQGG